MSESTPITLHVNCVHCGFATGLISEIEAFATATAHNHTGVKITGLTTVD